MYKRNKLYKIKGTIIEIKSGYIETFIPKYFMEIFMTKENGQWGKDKSVIKYSNTVIFDKLLSKKYLDQMKFT